jgi:hypothetical protein
MTKVSKKHSTKAVVNVVNTTNVTSDGAVVGRMVDNTIAAAKALAPALHTTVCSTCLHVLVHGDPIHMNRLFQNIGGGFRREAMAKFMIKFGGVKYVKGNKDKGTEEQMSVDPDARAVLKAEYEKDASAFVSKLTAKPFWDVTKEVLFREYDLLKVIEREVKKATAFAKGVKPSGETLTEEEQAMVDVTGLSVIADALKRAKVGLPALSALH